MRPRALPLERRVAQLRLHESKPLPLERRVEHHLAEGRSQLALGARFAECAEQAPDTATAYSFATAAWDEANLAAISATRAWVVAYEELEGGHAPLPASLVRDLIAHTQRTREMAERYAEAKSAWMRRADQEAIEADAPFPPMSHESGFRSYVPPAAAKKIQSMRLVTERALWARHGIFHPPGGLNLRADRPRPHVPARPRPRGAGRPAGCRGRRSTRTSRGPPSDDDPHLPENGEPPGLAGGFRAALGLRPRDPWALTLADRLPLLWRARRLRTRWHAHREGLAT